MLASKFLPGKKYAQLNYLLGYVIEKLNVISCVTGFDCQRFNWLPNYLLLFRLLYYLGMDYVMHAKENFIKKNSS